MPTVPRSRLIPIEPPPRAQTQCIKLHQNAAQLTRKQHFPLPTFPPAPGAKRTQVRQPSWRGVANERVARSRSSSPDRPRVMRCRPRGRRRSVDRGRCRPAMYSPESVYSPGRRRTFGCAEGHTGRFAMARTGRVRRGRRTRARVKTPREDARRTGVLRPVRCLSSTPGDRSWEISRSAAERQPRPASTIPHQGAPR